MHPSVQTALARQGVAHCKRWRNARHIASTLRFRTSYACILDGCRQGWSSRPSSRCIMRMMTATHRGPLSPRSIAIGRHGHALARSKCVALAAYASVERRDAREGSYASEARTARGRQCFERMNGGIIGGFGSRCQAESFLEVRLSLWNGGSVEMRGVEKNYKKYVDSSSRKGWLTGKRNV